METATATSLPWPLDSMIFALEEGRTGRQQNWVAYLRNNPGYVTSEGEAKYIARMAAGAWAEGEIIIAVGNAIGVQIHVYMINTLGVVQNLTAYGYFNQNAIVRVLYNGQDHFDALLPFR